MTYSSASGGPVAAITAGAAAGTGTAAAGALENTTSSTSHYGPIAEDLIDTASSKKHGKEGKPAFDHNISIHMQRIRKIKGADVVEHAADEEDVYRKLRRLLRKLYAPFLLLLIFEYNFRKYEFKQPMEAHSSERPRKTKRSID